MAGVALNSGIQQERHHENLGNDTFEHVCLLTVPAFADQSHHPDQAAAEVPAGAMFERMQDNLKIMQGNCSARRGKDRRRAAAGHG